MGKVLDQLPAVTPEVLSKLVAEVAAQPAFKAAFVVLTTSGVDLRHEFGKREPAQAIASLLAHVATLSFAAERLEVLAGLLRVASCSCEELLHELPGGKARLEEMKVAIEREVALIRVRAPGHA